MANFASQMPDFRVIFTATVRPNDAAILAHRDDGQREEDYIRAVRFNTELARKCGRNGEFILLENSGAEAVKLREACAQLGVRYLPCTAMPTEDFRGKGQAEALMMDEALKRLASEGNPMDCPHVKVTGRLMVKNFDRVIQGVIDAPQDCRANLYRSSILADTRVFSFRMAFWPHLMDLVDLIDDSKERYIEHIMPIAMRTAVLRGLKCDYLLPAPRLSGFSASTGRSYSASGWRHWCNTAKILLWRKVYPLTKQLNGSA